MASSFFFKQDWGRRRIRHSGTSGNCVKYLWAHVKFSRTNDLCNLPNSGLSFHKTTSEFLFDLIIAQKLTICSKYISKISFVQFFGQKCRNLCVNTFFYSVSHIRVGSPTPQRTHLSGAACHVMVANDATCETFANETFPPRVPLTPLPLNHDWS